MRNQDFKKEFINRTFNFSLNIIKLVTTIPANNISKVIVDQLIRSSFSIGANLAEAQGSSSKNEFKNFIHHSYKSSIETRYWLALLDKSSLTFERKQLIVILKEAQELSKILSSILLTLKGKKTLN